MIVPARASLLATACPLLAETSKSPLAIVPVTLTGTRPWRAISATYSASNAEFIEYAGLVVTTPATLVESNAVDSVTSCSPPNNRTVPGSYVASATYFSAISA